MSASPTATRTKATVRMIAASFTAGACAMAFIGLAAPLLTKGALSVVAAEASSIQRPAPLIEPLDVAAVNAQLSAAAETMAAARATTDDDIARLNTLVRR